MNRHAKASSGGSTQRQGSSLGRFFRGAFATRGGFGNGDGSGAPAGGHATLLALAVAALVLLAFAPAASASITTRLQSATIGGVSAPQGLAVDQSTGSVYVIESGQIGRYTSAGAADNFAVPGGSNTISQSGLGGGGEAEIAVDNAPGSPFNGAFYVRSGAGGVAVYASSGEKLGELTGFNEACGVAVDQSSGALYVGDYSYGGVRRFTPTSATAPVSKSNYTETSIKTEGMNPCQVAADKVGHVYVSAYSSGPVKVFDASEFAASPPSLSGTTIDAASNTVMTDPGNNNLYVDEGDQIAVFNSSGSLLYNFGSGAIGSGSRGVAVKEGGNAYVANGSDGSIVVFSPEETFADASASTAPATSIGGTSATLNATITDNNALPTSWRLELSADGGANWSPAESGTTAGGQVNVAVSANANGLVPNTIYKFRVVTNKGSGPATEVASSALTFKTVAAAPAVSNVGSVQVTDSSARLVGTVNPNNAVTGYVFEYGTTPALGSSTVAVNIGGGLTPKVISQVVSGLDKDTDYYFRLVASNLTGTTTSSSALLHTRATPLPLPEDRAYEQVSPIDKNGGEAFATPTGWSGDLYASADGDAVGFTGRAGFGDSPAELTFTTGAYFTRRTASGWTPAASIRPPFCINSTGPGLSSYGIDLGRDLRHAAITQVEGLPGCGIAPLDPDAPLNRRGVNLYRTDLGGPPSYDLLNPQLGASPSLQEPNGSYRGASDDQSHIVLGSTGPQTPDSPTGGNYQQLYDWQQLGTPNCSELSSSYNPALEACLSLVSKDPAGNPFTTNSDVPGSIYGNSDFGNGNRDAINAVSATGERIFFENPVPFKSGCRAAFPTCQVYMREGDAVTHDVSQSECTASCGSEEADHFKLASPSGDAVLLTSAQRLTDSDTSSTGEDLFLYRHSANPATDLNLTDVSIDDEPADGTSADVQDVVGASDDLETVFFVANGQLVPGEPTAAGPKLYRWRWNSGTPTLQYLATLDAADGVENWEQAVSFGGGLRRERRVTPSGEDLILESKVQLDPVADQDTDVDVYRWSENKGFQCVSCQPPGVASGGPSDTGKLGRPVFGDALALTNEMSSAISDDGERIFFQTQDSLVPQDTNGPCTFDSSVRFYPCTDVYEWHDGAVSLITPGDSADQTAVALTGATPSGGDVYFATRQSLVGWDLDKNIDIYDARVGGGFPEPAAGGAECEGEACRGAATSPSAGSGPGTPNFQGPGNPASARCPKGKVVRHGSCVNKPRKRHRKRAHNRAANHNRRASR